MPNWILIQILIDACLSIWNKLWRISKGKNRGKIKKLIAILVRIRSRGKIVEDNSKNKGKNNSEYARKSTNLLKLS